MYLTRSTQRAVVVALALTLSVGCATAGHTPEGLAADYGVRIAKVVGATQEAIGTVGKTSTNQAVRDGAVKALQALQQVNIKGSELASKLDLIRQARAAGQAPTASTMQGVLTVIDQIDAAVDLDVIPKLGDYPETKAALTAAREISKLILTIQFELGRMQSS